MGKKELFLFSKNVVKPKKAGGVASRQRDDRWLSTGSLSLDTALGGGVAVGYITMFYGEKSGGKTTSIARTCGIAQGICRNCFRPAVRDAWSVFVETGEDGTGGSLIMAEGEGEVRVFSRVEAHDHLVGLGMELAARGSEGYAFYSKADVVSARVERVPGPVESVPPSDEEIAELGEDARWSASGYCDCHAEGLFKTEEEPKKESSEKPKEYAARVERWKLCLQLNSYEEFVIAWVDLENAYHKGWFSKLGVDSRRVLLIKPTNAEEAIDICHAMALTNEVDLMVIDSIAQLVPQKEITASMEEWQQGLQARIVNKAGRKLVSAMTQQEVRARPMTQMWTNQTREKIGVMFGDPTVKPGGKGQDFVIHAEVKFMRSKRKTVAEQYGSKDEVVTIPIEETISFKTTKNRVAATNGSEGEYVQSMRDNDFGPQGTVLEDDYIFKLAMHYLIVNDKKKGIYAPREGSIRETIGDYTWTSQKEILSKVREDKSFKRIVKTTLLDHVLHSTSAIGAGKSAPAEG
jgi:RecA/RadA recombinase